MMPLGGGRAIITLRVADRDRGRRRDCQRSWEVTCHHFILVLSLYRWGNVAMAGCCDNVQDLLTSVNDPDKHIRIVDVGHLGAL